MKLFRIFGIGADKILVKNCYTDGIVTAVGNSYIHVVKKPVRIFPNEHNTLYSHYIFFTYAVNGLTYKGKLYVDLNYRCPQKGERIDIYYDPEKPENYACYAFPAASRPIGW